MSYSSEQCDSEGRSRRGKEGEIGVRVWNRMPSSHGGDFTMVSGEKQQVGGRDRCGQV